MASEEAAVTKAGFITPPAWFDISPMEFVRVAPAGTLVIQTLMRPQRFSYTTEGFRSSVPELIASARALAAADVDIVAQVGYPFAFVHGWEGALNTQQDIEHRIERPFVMMGVEAVRALQHLGARRVAVAATYYGAGMRRLVWRFLEQAGIGVTCIESWETLGLVKKASKGAFAGSGELDPMGWKTPVWAVEESLRRVAGRAPDVDAIFVAGGGMRLLDIAAPMERELGIPMVAGDLSLYWGILRRIENIKGAPGWGRLLAGPFPTQDAFAPYPLPEPGKEAG